MVVERLDGGVGHFEHLDAGRLEGLVLELERIPNRLDALQRLVDLDLHARLLDDLAHRVGELVQFKREQHAKRELVVHHERLATDAHELLPVALAHGIVAKVLHERQVNEHVSHLIHDAQVAVPVAHGPVERLDLLLELGARYHHAVHVDIGPECVPPRTKDVVDELNVVPDLLEQLELVTAHLDLLPVLLVDVEEPLALLERLGVMLDFVNLGVPLVEALVALLANFIFEWRVLFEFVAEVDHLVTEFGSRLLDLLGLQRLQRRELLARIVRDARAVAPAVRRVVEHLDVVSGDDHAVLFEQLHLGTQRIKQVRDQVGTQPHVADARHRAQQRLGVIGLDLMREAVLDGRHKVLELDECLLEGGLQVVRVPELPLVPPGGERRLDRACVNLEPAPRSTGGDCLDLTGRLNVPGNRLVESG